MLTGETCMKRICFTIIYWLLVGSTTQAQPIPNVNLWTPDSSVKFALADLKTLPPNIQPYIRYLSLYNTPKEHRKKFGQTVSFVVNSLGTRRKMYIPVFVGGSDETVIRLNIKEYEWKTDQFDNLARNGSGPRPFPEPYFHCLIDVSCFHLIQNC